MATLLNAVTRAAILFLASVMLTSSMPMMMTPPEARLSIADSSNYYIHEPEGPGTYSFGYDVEDPPSFRLEERSANGTVIGAYGYLQDDGTLYIVEYIADHLGYRAKINTMRLRERSPFAFKKAINDIRNNWMSQ